MSVKRFFADDALYTLGRRGPEVVLASDYDHAIAIDRGKLEKADAENQRLQSQVDALIRQLADSCDEARSDPEMHVNGCPIAHTLQSQVEALRAALEWIARVNACDYEYVAKARAALSPATGAQHGD
jgi:hypothetical protein